MNSPSTLIEDAQQTAKAPWAALKNWLSHHPWLALSMLLLLVSFNFFIAMSDSWNLTADGVQYMGFARNWAQGHGFGQYGTGYTIHGPLLSVYAAAGFLAGRASTNVQLLELLALLGSLALIFLLIRRICFSVPTALFCTAMSGFNFGLIHVGVWCLSENLYLALSLAGLAASLRLWQARSIRWPWLASLALLTAMAILTRKIGVALVPAAVAAIFFAVPAGIISWKHRILASALVVLAALAPLVAWEVYLSRQTSPQKLHLGSEVPSYYEAMAGVPKESVSPLLSQFAWRLKTFGLHRIEQLTQAMWTITYRMSNTDRRLLWPGYLLCVPWDAMFLAGWWHEFRKGRRMMEWYVILYLLVIIFWPYDEQERFLLPLVPMGWYYLARLATEWSLKYPKIQNYLPIMTIALVLITAGVSYGKAHREAGGFKRQATNQADVAAVADYLAVRGDVPVRNICLCTRSSTTNLIRLFSDRLIPNCPYQEKVSSVLSQMLDEGKQLIVLDLADRRGKPLKNAQAIPESYRSVLAKGTLQVIEKQ